MNNYRLSAISPTSGPLAADDITRGVCRHLRDLGYSPLTEFKLRTNRRVDVIGLDKGGRFLVAEVKSSVADFR
ncbi:MAG: MmcB family DNA repair protein, partial [Rhodospirillales bacterium]|nr:MmcB family DNA repair protein [Rhodospirillales bacterium]